MGASPYHVEQHLRPSTVRQEQKTTPMAYPFCGIWVNWCNVWQCRFDNSDDLFAIKIVEVLRRSDADSRQRLRNEFNVYLTLEEAYQSRQPRGRISPCCYGAFEGDGVDVIVLELCGGILREWYELSDSER